MDISKTATWKIRSKIHDTDASESQNPPPDFTAGDQVLRLVCSPLLRMESVIKMFDLVSSG